jgi:hypothetical protein
MNHSGGTKCNMRAGISGAFSGNFKVAAPPSPFLGTMGTEPLRDKSRVATLD